jgi:hypothetical protein
MPLSDLATFHPEDQVPAGPEPPANPEQHPGPEAPAAAEIAAAPPPQGRLLSQALRHRMRKMLRHVAPDMAAVPIYFVDALDIPAAHHRDVGAWTSPADCFLYRKQIEATDGWAGPGVTIVVMTPKIREAKDAALMDFLEASGNARPETRDIEIRRFDQISQETTARCLLLISLHEFAHNVDHELTFPDEGPTPEDMAKMDADRIASAATEEDDARIAPWQRGGGHGPEFFRVHIHLHSRAVRLGYVSEDSFTDEYGIFAPRLEEYRAALAPEIERFSGEDFTPFATIRATRPPAAFLRLVEATAMEWRTADEGKERTRAKLRGLKQILDYWPPSWREEIRDRVSTLAHAIGRALRRLRAGFARIVQRFRPTIAEDDKNEESGRFAVETDLAAEAADDGGRIELDPWTRDEGQIEPEAADNAVAVLQREIAEEFAEKLARLAAAHVAKFDRLLVRAMRANQEHYRPKHAIATRAPQTAEQEALAEMEREALQVYRQEAIAEVKAARALRQQNNDGNAM